MSRLSRILTAAAGLILIVMYFSTLWRIDLGAPQYPEGLGLRITLTDIRGASEFDLQKINNLNHYIGMKQIVPEAIPELRIMPWIIAFLIVTALIAAAVGRRWLHTTWLTLFLIISIVGLVDFWLWEYDYGHDLDTENAAIVVPGMAYQPPLIGSKQLLNFKAHSWPGLGGYAAFLSMGLGMLAWGVDWKRGRQAGRSGHAGGEGSSASGNRSMAAAALLAGLSGTLLAACTPEPEPFHFGEDAGAYCRMTIDDNRFASQVVMQTGRAYKFDAIECLASWLETDVADETDIHSIWVTNMAEPGALIPALQARFVQHEAIRSPMGGGWAAFETDKAALEALRMLPARDSAAPSVSGETPTRPETYSWLEMRRKVHIH